MVRVPWKRAQAFVGKVLDAGAYGVICPMINTVEEAKAFVSYCRYPPAGARSNGPIRAGIYGVRHHLPEDRPTRRCCASR